jgi:hypothetical protein
MAMIWMDAGPMLERIVVDASRAAEVDNPWK